MALIIGKVTENIVNGNLCPQAEDSSSISWIER